MLTLLGVAVVVLGFAARFNPLLVVVAAAMVTGLAAGLPPLQVLAALGKGFNDNRLVTVALLVYPVVGVHDPLPWSRPAKRVNSTGMPPTSTLDDASGSRGIIGVRRRRNRRVCGHHRSARARPARAVRRRRD